MKSLLASLVAGAALLATASPALAEAGTTIVRLTELYAVMQTGAPAPQYDSYCRSRFENYLDLETSTRWNINPQTAIMWADTMVLESRVSLHPLGIYGRYAFMSDGVPPALSDRYIDRVTFVLDESFEDAELDLLFVFGAHFNCVLSNKPLA